jgi:hypothetical protein
MQPQRATDPEGNGLHRLDETDPASQGKSQQVDDASHLGDGHDSPA